MKILILDTATEYGVVGLAEDEELLSFSIFQAGMFNARNLLSEVERLFSKVSWPKEDLKGIIVGTGPGSYTGIRVHTALAKGISMGLSIPIVGVSSLKCFVPEDSYEGKFLSVIDARIGGVYLLEGVKDERGCSFFGDGKLCEGEKARSLLQNAPYIVTPKTSWCEKFMISSHVVERGPDLQVFLKEGEKALKSKKGSVGCVELQYLRQTQAEIERKAKE